FAGPDELSVEDSENLSLWAPWVRASLFEFELCSRLAFTPPAAAALPPAVPVTLWHQELSGGGQTSNSTFVPLVERTRPGRAQFQTQLDYLNSYAQLRPDRAEEIASQLTSPVTFLASIGYLHSHRTPHTLELLALAQRLANL